MTTFTDKWHHTVKTKNSILCVGLDPQEMQDKKEWCIKTIKAVSPYAAAVKINRNYIFDLSRAETQEIVNEIHKQKMLAIIDNKLSDIGSTNEAGFHHAAVEGFDAITVSPFPGNMQEAVTQSHQKNLGIIFLALMSNPEYATMKNARINEKKLFLYLAEQAQKADADGIVIGAPSEKNHIRAEELTQMKEIANKCLVLVPGIGAQGGDIAPVLKLFEDNVIANVGRAIINAENPAMEAKKYNEMLNALRT